MATVMPTTASIIERFKNVHGDKYDYSDVVYVNSGTPVKIRCKKHDITFQQLPGNHIFGKGCPQCGIEKRAEARAHGTDEFISRFKKKHGDKYDYSKVGAIKNGDDIITIGCKLHGDFTQKAYRHLYGSGCPECGRLSGKTDRTLDSFISDANKQHNNKYDYSKFKFTTTKIPSTIICPLHGEFEQTPKTHLKGNGCPICGKLGTRVSADSYFQRAREKHGDKYDYSESVYNGGKYPITYKCKFHGLVTQNASGHLQYGCVKCMYLDKTKTQEKFIEQLKKKFGDKYNFDKTVYINDATPVTFTCPEHGDVKRIASDLIREYRNTGCPICNSSNGEKIIYMWLMNNGYEFSREYKLPNYRYRYDFFIPKLRLFIEFHGIQHFYPVRTWGGEKGLEQVKITDGIKAHLISKNNCELLTITYLEEKEIPNILSKYLEERKRVLKIE